MSPIKSWVKNAKKIVKIKIYKIIRLNLTKRIKMWNKTNNTLLNNKRKIKPKEKKVESIIKKKL